MIIFFHIPYGCFTKPLNKVFFNHSIYKYNVMFLWSVVILELDGHPDQNKGPDPRMFKQKISFFVFGVRRMQKKILS